MRQIIIEMPTFHVYNRDYSFVSFEFRSFPNRPEVFTSGHLLEN